MRLITSGSGRWCRPAAALLLLLALAGAASAANPSWYTCDYSNCKPPSCMCASTHAPGGISPEDTPQFIVLTHDDAINTEAYAGIHAMTDKHTNPNGCKPGATWFTIKNGTDCKLALDLYKAGHEIAMHTLDHYKVGPEFKPPSWNADVPLDVEMVGVRDWLNDTCGIPKDKIVGFRSPYLAYGPMNREILFKEGALYDSSMVESWSAGSTSPSADNKTWPFSMDHGIPTNCNYFGNDTQCNQQEEKYPGLWEFPLYQLQDPSGTPLYSMDPGTDVYKVLRENFDAVYSGNRAPFGLYVHAPWCTTTNVDAANKFFTYALSKGDVWMVTMHQVIQWMQNPVPKQKMNDWFKCAPGGVVTTASAPAVPAASPVDVPTSSGTVAAPAPSTSQVAPAAAPAVMEAQPVAEEQQQQEAPAVVAQPEATTIPAAAVSAAPAPTTPTASSSSGSSSGGLSTGAIAGIAVGGAVAVAALAGVAVHLMKKKAAAAAAAAAASPGGAFPGAGATATVTTGAVPKVANMA